MLTWKHGTEIQTLNLTHLRLCWKSALEVSEKMEKLPHLHKYQQPCALASSAAWLDDRAPEGRVVSGSSGAFTIDWELSVLGEHNRSGVCCPIRDQWCKSAVAIEILNSPKNAILVTQLFALEFSLYSFIQAADKYIMFYFKSNL